MVSPDKESISVITTAASDTIMSADHQVLAINEGGPAHFISRALTARDVSYVLHTGDLAEVQIITTSKGETGSLSQDLRPREISQAQLHGWTIISTITNEWILPHSVSLPPFLCIDVQGFTRGRAGFGSKQLWRAGEALIDKVYCLKGTKEEVNYLPEELRESQKQRLLVVTDGGADIEIYDQGQHFAVPVQPVDGLADSIGAGDTFFANFVIGLYQGQTAKQSAHEAVELTRHFLEAKSL